MADMNYTRRGSVVAHRGGGLLIGIGWICALLSLIFYPFIFGVLGVIMGILGTRGGSRSGVFLIVGSILLMGVGLIYSPSILNYSRGLLGV